MHESNEDDGDHHLKFLEIIDVPLNQDPHYAKNNIFSDEFTFSVHDQAHEQNIRYWASENSIWYE